VFSPLKKCNFAQVVDEYLKMLAWPCKFKDVDNYENQVMLA
jgi:hypothetical protein